MNDKNSKKQKGKVSKKLQLTLNFKPEEILHIIQLDLDFKNLPNDYQKAIDYLNIQKESYLFKIQNGSVDLNVCSIVIYLEIFKIKKIYIKQLSQSYSEQMVSINRISGSLQFCKQFINQHILLFESDIRGRCIILFYLFCEVYWNIEISDFSGLDDILEKFKKKVIVFYSNFEFNTLSKNERKNCQISLMRYYSSQLIGTIGLIQFELQQYSNAYENLNESIKTRLENIEDKDILENYLNNQVKIFEYELVFFYLNFKKCVCLLNMGRFAESSYFGNTIRQKVKQKIDSLNSDTKQSKALAEVLKQLQNIYVKIVELVEKSNQNARQKFLDNDLNNLLKEIKGNEIYQNENEKILFKDQNEKLLSQNKNEDQQSKNNQEENKIDKISGVILQENLSPTKQNPTKKKYSPFKMFTTDNIQIECETKSSNIKQKDVTENDQIESEAQNLYFKKEDLFRIDEIKLESPDQQLLLSNKNSFQQSRDSENTQRSPKQMKDIFLRKKTKTQEVVRVYSFNPEPIKPLIKVEMPEELSALKDNSFNELNNFSLLKVQNDQLQSSQVNALLSNKTLKSNSQNTLFSAQTFQKDDSKEKSFQSNQKSVINTQAQLIQEKFDSKKVNIEIDNQFQIDNQQKFTERFKSEENRRKTQKIKNINSKINITNISYFFKQQESQSQQSICQILQSNKTQQKNGKDRIGQSIDQFINSIGGSSKQKNIQQQQQATQIQNMIQQQNYNNQNIIQNENFFSNQDVLSNQEGLNRGETQQNYEIINFQDHLNYQELQKYKIKDIHLNRQLSDQSLSKRIETFQSNINEPSIQQQPKQRLKSQSQVEIQNQGYLSTETRYTESNNPKIEKKRKMSNNHQNMNTESYTLNTQTTQEQGQSFQFKTLQTQQRTLNTENGENILPTQLKTEISQNISKQRKQYQKMTLEQFQQFEVNNLIDYPQTERNNQLVGKNIPVQQYDQQSNIFNQIPLQMPRKGSATQFNPQMNIQNQISPSRVQQKNISRNFQDQNQQNREQLFQQITQFSQLKGSQKTEYQLIQFEQQPINLQSQNYLQQPQNNVNNFNHNRQQQSVLQQKKQINFDRKYKQRKSSISQFPSSSIGQLDQQCSKNVSQQQNQTQTTQNFGQLQELVLNKEISKEDQNVNNQLLTEQFMHVEQIYDDPIITQVENKEQSYLNQRNLSPAMMPMSQISGFSQEFQNIQNKQQKMHPELSINKTNSYVDLLFRNLNKKKRYSRSTHASQSKQTSRSTSANERQKSHLRNRLLSSQRDSQGQMRNTDSNMIQTSPNSFALVSSNQSFNTNTQTINFNNILQVDKNNDNQVKELLHQRPHFNLDNFKRSFNSTQISVNRKPSYSTHNITRPATASVQGRNGQRQKSISQHQNHQQQDKSILQNLNNNSSLNYLTSLITSPKQSNKLENNSILSDQMINQIQVKQVFQKNQRPSSSQTYLNQRRKFFLSQPEFISNSNISVNFQKFNQGQNILSKIENNNSKKVNNKTERDIRSASTRSKTEYNYEHLLSNNQQSPALQVLLSEMEFQKKLEVQVQQEKQKMMEQNKKSVKQILTQEKENAEHTLIDAIENVSQIIDENNKQKNQNFLKKSTLDSSFGIKSQRRIKISSSGLESNRNLSSHRIKLSRSPSIEKHPFLTDKNNNYLIEEQSVETVNQQDESGTSYQSQKNSQLNKLRMEILNNKEGLMADFQNLQGIDEYPNLGNSRSSKTEINSKTKKSRFAQPKKMEESTPRRRQSQNQQYLSQLDKTSSFNLFQDKKSFLSKNQLSQYTVQSFKDIEEETLKNTVPHYTSLGQVLDKQNQNQSNLQGESEGYKNNKEENQIFLKDLQVEGQEENNVQQNSQYQEMQKNKFNGNENQYEKSKRNSQFEKRGSKFCSSVKEEIHTSDQEEQNKPRKQWHNQQHKLNINKNLNIDTIETKRKTPQQSQNSDGQRSPVPSTKNNIDLDSCLSTSRFITKRLNLQMKVPKNLDLKKPPSRIPSYVNLEMQSTLSKINPPLSTIQRISIMSPYVTNQTMIVGSRPQLQFSQHKVQYRDRLKSIQYFNQSIRIQSQNLLQINNQSVNEVDEQNGERKNPVSLFKLFDGTNKSYEARNKFINSISGINNGIQIMNLNLCYPAMIFYMYNNGKIQKVRLSIVYVKEESINLEKEQINKDEDNKSKLTIDIKPQIQESDLEIENGTLKQINNQKEEIQKEIDVDLVIQYDNHQKVYIPINLNKGLQNHQTAEHSLLVTVWPLVFKEFQIYMQDNHLIDIEDKRFLGYTDDEENQDEQKIHIFEEKQYIKSQISKYFIKDQINPKSESMINSQIIQSYKSPSLLPRPMQMNTLLNIPLLDEEEKQNKYFVQQKKQPLKSKKYSTMVQIPNNSGELNLKVPFQQTSDSNVNRKLQFLSEQFEDISINYQFFGGLQQYFGSGNSPILQQKVQKKKKKVLSLIDLVEIQDLKQKIASFLNFSFIVLQKEIGKAFVQDISGESFHRYYMKPLLYLKRKYQRVKASIVEFPDSTSKKRMYLQHPNYPPNPSKYKISSQSIEQQQPSLKFERANNIYNQNKSSQTSLQNINFKVFEKSNGGSSKGIILNKQPSSNSSSSISLVSEELNESFSISSYDKSKMRSYVLNSNVRKTIFCNNDQIYFAKLNYCLNLKETQGFIQNILETQIKATPPIILSFLKKSQGQYFLVVVKLVIKQETLFNKIFNDEGEIDIKDNYYFYVTARTLNQNLKMRVLLPPIEVYYDQLKPYFYYGEYYQGINAQINRFLMHGQMKQKQLLQLISFFQKQIGITSFDKFDGSSKQNKQKLIFKDTILYSQMLSDWNSSFGQNLELYNIIYRQFQEKQLIESSPTSNSYISKNYSNLFLANFNTVYQENIKSKRVALSQYQNYDDNDDNDDKFNEKNNKIYEQYREITYSLPKVIANDLDEKSNYGIELKIPAHMQRGSIERRNTISNQLLNYIRNNLLIELIHNKQQKQLEFKCFYL